MAAMAEAILSTVFEFQDSVNCVTSDVSREHEEFFYHISIELTHRADIGLVDEIVQFWREVAEFEQATFYLRSIDVTAQTAWVSFQEEKELRKEAM